MGLFDKFFGVSSSSDSHLPVIFPLGLNKDDFIRADLISTYQKILTDVVERTHGLKEADKKALWDNCLQSEANIGLVTYLAESMTMKRDLFLVFKDQVLRVAEDKERVAIENDYKTKGESTVGVFVSFKKYRRTDMLLIYSDFEYCTLSSLNKVVNLSKAVQVKISKLRSTVSLHDVEIAKAQAKEMADALEQGRAVLMDREDAIETATPDIAPTEKAISFLDSKRAWYLGLPLAYITGEQTAGIGSSGENDMRAVERGLQQYFVSIIKPVCDALFKVSVEFRSQDFRQIQSGVELGKGLTLIDDSLVSLETKQKIMAVTFNLNAEEELARIEAESKARPAPVQQNQGNG